MGKKKKRKHTTPRRMRTNRAGRLALAPNWVKEYKGKNIVRSYSKWFGVNLLCASTELRMIGVKISDEDHQRIIQQEETKRIKAEETPPCEWGQLFGYDDDFAFIAGFTSGGAPFGTTHWELERLDTENCDELPF